MLRLKLRSLFGRRAAERGLDDELRFHLERQVELHIAEGMPPEEARRRAQVEFGSVEAVREECRDARGLVLLQTVAQDLRYAARVLKKSPGFTAVAVLSLALGIGANTALFSLADAALWTTLPVKDPEQLVQVAILFDNGKGWYTNAPPALYEELSRAPRSFSEVFGFTGYGGTLQARAGAEVVNVHQVTGNYYAALGVPALLGRTLTREDENSTAAVLSYSYWAQRFNRDPAVLGTTVYLDRTPVTIVGVTPPGFYSANPGLPPDISIPPGKRLRTGSIWIWARLKPGVTLAQARPEVELAYQRYLEQLRPVMRDWSPRDRSRLLSERATLFPGANGTPGMQLRFADTLKVLLAFTGVVLLIGCANIANLLLARAAARANEIGLRLAIGAGRRRLVRQLLTESVLLSLLGAAVGLLFAFWGHRALLGLAASGNTPEVLAFRLDRRVLAFTAAVSILTGVLFGLAPALRATRLDVLSALKREHRQGTARNGLARSLVTLQVAAAVVLLAGAGLFVRTLENLRAIDPGFRNPESILLLSVDAGQTPRDATLVPELYREMARRVEALPGVRAAALARTSALGGGWWGTVWVEGYAHRTDEDQRCGSNNVGPGFFAAAGVPVLLGREFTERDVRGAPEVVIINETLARRYFPGVSPIGRRLGLPKERGKWTIVGVVADVRYGSLRQNIPPMIYHPLLQTEQKAAVVVLHVRTVGEPALMVSRIRREIASIDRQFPILNVTTLAGELNRTLRRERMFAMLSGFFGLLALGLTCVGLYGVIAYAVARRTQEIGLRMALGAARGAVLWMVLRDTLLLILAGAAIGVPAALASTRLIRTLLFGLTPGDPLTLAGATLVLAGVGVLAGYLPARRAARLDPMAALRYE